MQLSTLKALKGARKKHRRLGRGEGSGRGKTSGRGGKGQTARTGGTISPGFEGGQMPLYRRLPKLGFTSRKQARGLNAFNVLNVEFLERFESGSEVDVRALKQAGCGARGSRKAGFKILGAGQLTKKLRVKVHAISAAAKQKIEAAGGSVELLGRVSSQGSKGKVS